MKGKNGIVRKSVQCLYLMRIGETNEETEESIICYLERENPYFEELYYSYKVQVIKMTRNI